MSELPQPHRFLLPIPSLTVEDCWRIGNVSLLPAGSVAGLIATQRKSEGRPSHPIDSIIDREHGARLNETTVAQVEATTPRVAYEMVSDALAIVRLFQHSRFLSVNTDWQTFGLPGQVRSWAVEYIDLDAGPGGGSFFDGAAAGWEFSVADRLAFDSDPGLRYLCQALSKSEESRTAFEHGAMIAARLFSASSLTYDADHKVLATVAALEVLLGEGGAAAQTYAVARRGAFLYCAVGTSPPSMCGRDRNSCPYLALSPSRKRDRNRVDALIAGRHGP